MPVPSISFLFSEWISLSCVSFMIEVDEEFINCREI